MQEDDSALLRFLQCKFGKGQISGPDFFYDPKYALRLCLKEKRMRACVHIYSMMSMHEEAVALALQVKLPVNVHHLNIIFISILYTLLFWKFSSEFIYKLHHIYCTALCYLLP